MKPLVLLPLAIVITFSACQSDNRKTKLDDADIATTVLNPWFAAGENTVKRAAENIGYLQDQHGKAKNVILFVGDGMGISTVTAARILAGQKQGLQGEEYQLSFEKFSFSGFSKTYNTDAQTPDSAGTMTALLSGVKTRMGVLGVNEDVVRGDCAGVSGNEVLTALELAELAGKSTGIISTARITHATPAAAYAKSADRNWEDDSDMPAEQRAAGCEDIALQLINFSANLQKRFNVDNKGIEVIMGGGRRHFLPKDAIFNSPDARSEIEGDRTDGRHLINEWKTRFRGGQYIMDQAGFDAIDTDNTSHLLALFNESHMQYEADRGNDLAGEPSLSQMTRKAIDILDNNAEGFFLTVEGGRIDHAHHAGNAYNALEDSIEFAKAVQAAVDNTDAKDTLIIVTADHSHVFTIAGYPKRGNAILGKVITVGEMQAKLAQDGMPFTTLAYANGRGYKDLGSETNADAAYAEEIISGRVDLANINTQSAGFHQEALVPLQAETHAGEDVGVYAIGPGAALITGTHEQNLIFHVMEFAADWIGKADAAVN
ncbi:MAG: alkaline phosphatase [Pseudomonadales bacterium]|nr:alkaline phosphatase [Pseudomonadales bacterium]